MWVKGGQRARMRVRTGRSTAGSAGVGEGNGSPGARGTAHPKTAGGKNDQIGRGPPAGAASLSSLGGKQRGSGRGRRARRLRHGRAGGGTQAGRPGAARGLSQPGLRSRRGRRRRASPRPAPASRRAAAPPQTGPRPGGTSPSAGRTAGEERGVGEGGGPVGWCSWRFVAAARRLAAPACGPGAHASRRRRACTPAPVKRRLRGVVGPGCRAATHPPMRRTQHQPSQQA